jgi:hypothetical protein
LVRTIRTFEERWESRQQRDASAYMRRHQVFALPSVKSAGVVASHVQGDSRVVGRLGIRPRLLLLLLLLLLAAGVGAAEKPNGHAAAAVGAARTTRGDPRVARSAALARDSVRESEGAAADMARIRLARGAACCGRCKCEDT